MPGIHCAGGWVTAQPAVSPLTRCRTVARLLALLMELSGERPLRVALAAPTGKAAQRLAESLRKAADVLPAACALPASIPTLHRLLGLRPDGSARHDADHPLACDLLLIDEASMVDLPLLARTLRALPAAARLILLGDPNQLASVEAGAVLGELCAGAGAYSPAAAARIESASGDAVPGDGPGGISDAVAKLEHSYRFAGGGAIGRLAAAVNAGDAQGALELLGSSGAVRFETVDTPARRCSRCLRPPTRRPRWRAWANSRCWRRCARDRSASPASMPSSSARCTGAG